MKGWTIFKSESSEGKKALVEFALPFDFAFIKGKRDYNSVPSGIAL